MTTTTATALRNRPVPVMWPAPAWVDRARFPVTFRSPGAYLSDGTNAGWCSGCLADFPAGAIGFYDTLRTRWCWACVFHVSTCAGHGCCIA